MGTIIDLSAFITALRKAEESRGLRHEANGELNAYLMENVLPAIMREEAPLLSEIQFEDFEAEDLGGIVDYLELRSTTERALFSISEPLKGAAPACVTSRVFC